MRFLFDDESFSFETLRAAGFALYGGADLGEVLATARRDREGDEASWHRAWKATAERLRVHRRQALAAGHRVSAREALLRASNYYRTARVLPAAKTRPPTPKSRCCPPAHGSLHAAAGLLDTPARGRIDPLRGHHPAGLPLPGRRLGHAPPDGDLHQRVRLHRGGVLVRGRRGRAAPRVQRAGLRRPRPGRGAARAAAGVPPRLGGGDHPGRRLRADPPRDRPRGAGAVRLQPGRLPRGPGRGLRAPRRRAHPRRRHLRFPFRLRPGAAAVPGFMDRRGP